MASMIFLPRYLYDNLKRDLITDEILRRREKYFCGTITFWQVDCFEGGCSSRSLWLKERAAEFEKKNNGIYIDVVGFLPERANINLQSRKPDIISYSAGVNAFEKGSLDVDLSEMREDVKLAVRDGCIPWCFGAYFLLENQVQEGDGNYYADQSGFENNEIDLSDFEEKNSKVSAFNAFMNGKKLFGTQRDIYRSEKYNLSFEATFVQNTDLVQLLSVTPQEDPKKQEAIEKFVSFLMSEQVQSKMGKLGLFPVNAFADPVYESPCLSACWQKIKKTDFKFECEKIY